MFTSLINLFFPKVCAGCDAFLLESENVLCTKCRHEMPLTNHYRNPENEAFKKFYGRIDIQSATAFAYYHKKGIVQEMIHKLKYKGQEEIGAVIGNWFAEDLKTSGIIDSVDCIIPVPLHKKRFKERGYNQVTAFGLALAENLGIAYEPELLVRKIYSKTQTKKNLLGRSEMDSAIFEVCYDGKHCNKHFLLIDDVLTTGSTLEACCRALLRIPGTKISIVCMAMSHS